MSQRPDDFGKWRNGLKSFLGKDEYEKDETAYYNSKKIGSVKIEDNLECVDVGFNIVFLRREAGYPAKVLVGTKFSPKPELSDDMKKSISKQIQEGVFLPKKFRDFLSLKITKIEDLRSIVNLFGKASRLLWEAENNPLKDMQLTKDMGNSFLKAFCDGWNEYEEVERG